MRQNWDDAKAHIYKYYKTQNKSLKELRRLMENNHDFRASPRSYLNKIVRWGYKKNVRKTVRPARPVGTATATAVLTPSLHTVADRISNSDQVLLPMVSSHRDDAQSFWPATGILESPHQDTLYHTYDGYEALQTTIPNSGIGNMSYQSPHVNDPVEEPLDMNGQNRLHHAAIDGDLERVRVLLSANCSLHETDYNGNQPLHYAARGLCVGIIDLLLKNGANVNARGEEGRTPLHLALRSTKAVNRLLQEHPTISAHDDKGDSALHMALSEASN
ncbi:hypothetical protein MMC18_002898, partial [Xylographa bjoerkii]|nr:hypothetical protein [Xylographa bjoerkii]